MPSEQRAPACREACPPLLLAMSASPIGGDAADRSPDFASAALVLALLMRYPGDALNQATPRRDRHAGPSMPCVSMRPK